MREVQRERVCHHGLKSDDELREAHLPLKTSAEVITGASGKTVIRICTGTEL